MLKFFLPYVEVFCNRLIAALLVVENYFFAVVSASLSL